MKKNIFLIVLISIFFSACSIKMPDILTFSSSHNYEEQLEEANICQNQESENSKLSCYSKIENSNSFAQIRLGTYWSEKKDFQKSLKYLNMAKESGNLYANLPISFLYYKGEGVKKDLDRSFELLKESSSIDPFATFQLSRFYFQGINTKVDIEKAINLLEFAGNSDVKEAQELLANIYKKGLFEQIPDSTKYLHWLNRSKAIFEDKNHKIYIF